MWKRSLASSMPIRQPPRELAASLTPDIDGYLADLKERVRSLDTDDATRHMVYTYALNAMARKATDLEAHHQVETQRRKLKELVGLEDTDGTTPE